MSNDKKFTFLRLNEDVDFVWEMKYSLPKGHICGLPYEATQDLVDEGSGKRVSHKEAINDGYVLIDCNPICVPPMKEKELELGYEMVSLSTEAGTMPPKGLEGGPQEKRYASKGSLGSLGGSASYGLRRAAGGEER